MKISFGNAIYNHKPTDADMKWHSGFLDRKKQPISCPVREDTVENYAFAYDNGICVKGYRFTSEKDIWKRTFICDFDNLTEQQFNKVVELVKNNPQGLRRIQGRFSSGMKVDLYNHEGIPDWKPTKWKYKVFFPLDEFYSSNGVMCVREEVEQAYLDVVQFFNQWSERKRTEEVARLWLKANNQSMYYKHGKNKGLLRNNHPALVIEDPMFKDYILPDPVEVTNPRHQITYSVVPEMEEPFKFLKDEDWERILGRGMASRFPATTKSDFTDLVDLPYDAKDSWEKKLSKSEKKLDNRLGEKNGTYKLVEKALNGCIRNQPEDGREIPTSKSGMAKKSGKNEWKDLMFDFQLASSTNRAIYTNWESGYDMEKVRKTMKDTVKFLVRCEAELELGLNGKPTRQSIIGKTIHDLPWYASKIFGETFIENMNQQNLTSLAKSISNAIEKACDMFKAWRLEQKCLKLMEENPELNGQWRMARARLGETANFEEYYKTKNELENSVLEQARSIEFPYVYVRRGLKKEMVEMALNEGRPMSKMEFVSFVMEKTVEHDGCVDEEKVEGWYRDYQSRFNKAQRMELGNEGIYGQMTGYQLKNGKVRKEHKSKYDELFKSKSRNEISNIIDSMNISRGRKSQLRKEWL